MASDRGRPSDAGRARVLLFAVALAVGACGGRNPAAPAGDAGARPCTEDWECDNGQTCAGGFCTNPSVVDAAVDSAGPPQIVVAPTVLTFGNPYVGGEYTQAFTIRNIGPSLLTIRQLDLVDNTANQDFSIDGPATPFTVVPDPQQSVTIVVVLRPTDNAVPSGVIHVISDDPSSLDVPVQLTATIKDAANLSVCVLTGATAADGCTVSPSDGSPLVDLGNIPYGGSANRVVSLLNGGSGNVAEKITAVRFTTSAPLDHYRLDVFTLDGAGAEIPVATFPYFLNPVDPSGQVSQNELRARVTFTADNVDGIVNGVSLAVDSDHPDNSKTIIPIIGQILGCRPVLGDGGVAVLDGGADPLTDPNNCGYCGHRCALDHATAKCEGGNCKVELCETNWGNCDGIDSNGCEADLLSSVSHCGSCARPCLNLHANNTACTGGQCVPNCSAGYDLCGGDPALGCAVSLSTVTNCGSCGATCGNAHGGTTCAGTACVPSCLTGFGDCDGHPENGCETDFSLVGSCGACSNRCTNANGTTTCNGTACVPVCDSSHGDCNGNPSDGCETDLTTVTYCGSCANDTQCSATFFCNGTQCEKKYGGGVTCAAAKECATGSCADAVCCDSPCDTPCKSCSLAGSVGTCSDLPRFATDSNPAAACVAPSACDGAGHCKQVNGLACPNGAPDCASGNCVDGVCCDAQCTGMCQACSAAKKGGGADGVCGNIGLGSTDDAPVCSGTNRCNGSGACLLANGQGCSGAGQCASNSCVDGVCCDTACGGTCVACTAAKKGAGADGVCGNIALNLTDDVPACSGTNRCNGGGACLLANGQGCGSAGQCASNSCVDGVCCDAACNGTCQACTAAKKGSGVDGACGTIGVGLTDDNPACSGASACDGAGTCKLANGQGCSGPSQCASNSCVDGVCCDSGCGGTCQACTAAKKGGGATGVCGNIALNLTDDAPVCAGTNRCNGGGACLLAAGQGCSGAGQCASNYCVDGVCCDGACGGTCQACTAAKKGGGSDGTCGSIAYNLTDDVPACAGANRCNGSGACLLVNGQGCGSAGQCASNNCADGVCCDTVCNGTCVACTAAKKGGGADGVCGNIAASLPDDVPACSGTSRCNGSGACLLANGQGCGSAGQCASNNCVDGVCCDSACNGACQACTAAKKGSGANGTCGNIGLALTDDNPACSGSNACNGGGACLLANGQGCSGAGQCASNSCVDGVCCDTACGGSCQACTAAKKGSGTNGVCGNIAASTDPDHECAGGLTCSGSGACNGTCAGDGTCEGGYYCTSMSGGACVAKAANGIGCGGDGVDPSGGHQCTSTFCVDGRCCESSCTATCKSCANAAGACTTNVGPGVPDPNGGCPAPNACDGAGGCCADNNTNDNTCGMVTLGTVDDNAVPVTWTGKIPETSGVVWFQFDVANSRWASNPATPSCGGGGGNPFHPQVYFSDDPGNEFQLEVMTDCGATFAACPDGGSPIFGTADKWERRLDLVEYGTQGECNCVPGAPLAGQRQCVNHAVAPDPTTFYVKVTRRGSFVASCSPFTITVINGN